MLFSSFPFKKNRNNAICTITTGTSIETQQQLKDQEKKRRDETANCDDDIKSLKLNQHIDKISKTFTPYNNNRHEQRNA